MAHVVQTVLETGKQRALEVAGGPARLQVIVTLAAVLGLDTADKGTVSAVSGQLKDAFGIGNTEIGLLLAVVSFVGALATLPMGIFADRVPRRTILLSVIGLWALAMIVSGTSTSYIYLMATRILLGAVTAAAWPCVASLTGDFFPARERAGIYGLILSGELIGAGVGFFISGEVSSVLSWRWSFYVMGAVSLGIWWLVWHHLPEPERGTQSWIELGARDPEAASRSGGREQDGSETSTESGLARETAREADVQPRRQLVLHEDPTRRSWWWTMRYLMHIPTYPLLIAASALAYYFFSGARAFAMIYFTEHYDLARSVVSALVIVVGIGAIAGVVAGGQMSEWLLRKGHLTVRIVLPAIALFVAVLFLGYGVWTPSVWIGITMLTIGAGALAAAVAPIDAARLDIIHPRMWGRAEAGRMALRAAFEGSAPLLFGAVSGWLGGGAEGLKWTFLIMLTPALAASLLAIPARRTYPRDVATAAASVEATSKRKGQNRSSG